MTTEQSLNKHEILSALADGQLRGTAFAQAVDSVLHDEEAQATWHRYHLIGDVLRSGESAVCGQDSAFLARLQGRLQQEPGFARPVIGGDVSAAELVAASVISQSAAAGIDSQNKPLREAANQPSFRWKMVAGFASLAAVAAIGWNLVGAPGALPSPAASSQMALVTVPGPAPIQLAAASEPAPGAAPVAQAVTLAGGEPQVMIRDPRLDELMAAHKQFGGTSALQMPAGFLRNATFEGPSR